MKKFFVSLLTLAPIMAFQSVAADFESKDSSEFEYKYEAEQKPEEEQPDAGWKVENVRSGGKVSFSDGKASITTRKIAGACSFSMKDGVWSKNVTDETSWTVETRVKVTAGAGKTPGFVVWANSKGLNTAFLIINPKKLFWGNLNLKKQIGGAMDNSSDFHNYRIVFDATTDKFTVWRDGELVGEDLDLGFKFNKKWLIFGDVGSKGSCTVEMDYFRWDITGAYAPGEAGGEAAEEPAEEEPAPPVIEDDEDDI